MGAGCSGTIDEATVRMLVTPHESYVPFGGYRKTLAYVLTRTDVSLLALHRGLVV